MLFNGNRVSALQDEKLLEMNGDDGCITITMQMYFIQLKGIVKSVKMVNFVLLYFTTTKIQEGLLFMYVPYIMMGVGMRHLSVLTWNNHYDQEVTVLTIKNNIFFLKMAEWD